MNAARSPVSSLPLTALRAFEAAARAGSFVLAGQALGVTSAAISLQVKALEDHLGKRLFLRQGNRITLTDAGRVLYPRLEAALSEIIAATEALQAEPARARLVISALPSLAELWLIPRLAGFARAIELRVEDDPVRLSQGGSDLRLTWGAHLYPDHLSEVLFRDHFVPVAAPGACPDFPDLARTILVQTDWGPSFGNGPDWGAWARAAGVSAPDAGQGLRVGRSVLAVLAARAGIGAALVAERLAAADLASGALVRLPGPALPMARDYVAVTSVATGRRRVVRDLIAHLRAAP